jgi:putative Ca2+/H+ antiporter (TMEM165/GDT1 family)
LYAIRPIMAFWTRVLPIFAATYGAVFVAEIVGDKLLYTTGVLAARYRTLPIMVGMAFAFMIKMAVAVLAGQFVSRLSPWLVATVTMVSFIGVAIAVWRKDERRAARMEVSAPKAAMVSFAAIFFSEWGDVGQITAAGLAASIGAGVRGWIQDHVSPKVIRYAGVALLLLLGVLSVVETLTEGHA